MTTRATTTAGQLARLGFADPGRAERLLQDSALTGSADPLDDVFHDGLPDALSAGLKGIEEGYDVPPETEDDVWNLTASERQAMGIDPLPRSLGRALEVMERSELVAETLGEHVFDFFLRNKRAEWEDYRSQVTQFELDRYLPRL